MDNMKFSLLMSIYAKEQAEFLDQCMSSIKTQTHIPSEIVIVEDGPLTNDLCDMLDKWEGILTCIRRVPLPRNVGLGMALNEGLKQCTYDFVARMDTDDVCMPTRFEKQIEVMKDKALDVCGTWVGEFEDDCTQLLSFRKPPHLHSDIVRLSKFRSPINHPTVVYRKSKVLELGGYENVLFFEDYHLWLKLIHNGCIFNNIEEPLVLMRAGIGQLSRRGGLKYAIWEARFLKKCGNDGFLSWMYVIRNMLLRFPIRLLPNKMLRLIYKSIRSN